MKKISIHAWLWLTLGLITVTISCTERMDIETDYASPRLVIIGYITTDVAAHKIQISSTVPYFGTEQPKTYSSAEVKINGVSLTPVGNGGYITDSSFYGVSGTTYHLEVWVDFDEDGLPEYYTASAVMPALHVLDSITLSPIRNGTTTSPWMIMMHFQDLPGENYFGAHLYINDTLYSNKIQRYFINFFGEYVAEGQYIHFPAVNYRVQKEMWWDYDNKIPINNPRTITLELNTLSAEYFEFVRTAKQEINGGNPLFAGPPANIPTNINGGAIGIFGAYTASRQKLILPPEEQW